MDHDWDQGADARPQRKEMLHVIPTPELAELRLPRGPILDHWGAREYERAVKRRELFVQNLASTFARAFTDALEQELDE